MNDETPLQEYQRHMLRAKRCDAEQDYTGAQAAIAAAIRECPVNEAFPELARLYEGFRGKNARSTVSRVLAFFGRKG